MSGDDSDDERALQRAQMLLEAGRSADALGIAGDFVVRYPEHPRTWVLLARCHLSAGNRAEAEQAVRRSLGLAPDLAAVHVWAAGALSTLGNRNLALDVAEEAVRLSPESASAHAAVARCATALAPVHVAGCLDHFLWQQARHHAREAVRLDPLDVDALFAIAYVNMRAGQDKAARRGFRAVLSVDPTCSAAQNNLAVLEMKRLRLIRAGRSLTRLAAAEPGSARAVRNVARVAVRHVAVAHLTLWLMYGCVLGAAAVDAPSGRFRWTWGLPSVLMLTTLLVLAGYLLGSWRSSARGVRSFATRRLLPPAQRLTVVACDVMMLCIALTVIAGALAWDVAALGLLLAAPVLALLIRAGNRPPR